ncbi:phage N-6-adenine-methyltransferase [Serratia marcescens]|uniref:phage N-6-adenine-methyltransferase n=1 Tax=Serratia marcescens TaxID=615 RepID=UPI00396CB702
MSQYCEKLAALRAQPAHELKEVGDQWRTPDELFWGINAMFGPLVLDLFTDGENSKCAAFYTAEDNALTQDWSAKLRELNGAAFGNPPYSRAQQHEGQYITGMVHIMAKAMEMREKGGRYVFLIKAATSETWWPEQADHIAFIRGRLGFDLPLWFVPADEKQVPTGAFFAGAVAVFDKNWRGPASAYISRNQLEAQGAAFLAQIRREASRLTPAEIAVQQVETANTVWPKEVLFLLQQVDGVDQLHESLRQKLCQHINRLKLEGMQEPEIVTTIKKLSIAMGAAA